MTACCLQDTVSTMAKDIAKSSNIDATQASAAELYQFMKRVCPDSVLALLTLRPDAYFVASMAACAICVHHGTIGTMPYVISTSPMHSLKAVQDESLRLTGRGPNSFMQFADLGDAGDL